MHHVRSLRGRNPNCRAGMKKPAPLLTTHMEVGDTPMSDEMMFSIRYFDKNVTTINGDRVWFTYSDEPLSGSEAFSIVSLLEERGCVVELTRLSA